MVTPKIIQIEGLLTEEFSDEDVREIPMESRTCRFPDETEGMWAFKYYSYTACRWQCRVDKSIELCNCSNYVIGNKGKN